MIDIGIKTNEIHLLGRLLNFPSTSCIFALIIFKFSARPYVSKNKKKSNFRDARMEALKNDSCWHTKLKKQKISWTVCMKCCDVL